MSIRTFLLVLSMGLASAAQAQSTTPELGKPFLTCYGIDDYGAEGQNWDFVQDKRGVLYVGNNLGILEFDGAAWRLIQTPSRTVIRSLDMGEDERIYVGAFADFGYLAPDEAGLIQYRSLLDYVPEELQAFNDVWTTHATEEGIYFQSRERLFRLTPTDTGEGWTVKSWEPETRFMFAFYLDGTYYLHQSGFGLMKMVNDELEMIPGGEDFANERLMVMLPFGDTGNYMVAPWNRGMFIFDGESFQPFASEANAYLRANTLYKGVTMPNGDFALATLEGGIIVVDLQGNTKLQLDRTSGLPNNAVNDLFADQRGLLWIAPENGICQVETTSPLSYYDASSGLTSSVADIDRHDGTLYVSNNDGIFYLDVDAARFQDVTGIFGSNQSFDLQTIDSDLLASVNSGLHLIEDGNATVLVPNVAGSFPSISMHQSKQDLNRVFVGLNDGLATVYRNAPGQWVEEGRIPGIHEYLTHYVEFEPGKLWLGAIEQGALRLNLPGPALENITVERFGTDHGLPAGGVAVFEAAGRAVFATKVGVFRFDEAAQQFEPDPLFNDVVAFGGTQEQYQIVEDHAGNIWINFGLESAVLRKQADGSYVTEKTALLRFADMPAYKIFPEENGVVWFGGLESIIRFDPTITKDYAVDFPALIRRVTIGEDSTLYGGTAVDMGASALPSVSNELNAMRFEYAATSFENPQQTRYQTILEGFDDHWSPWTKESRRSYTNLPPGDYTFRVLAQNIYQHQSREASFAFTMLAPWYRTGWAYALYILLAGGVLFSLVRLRTRQLHLRSQELERIIEERTAAIEQQKANVERLSEMGKELTASLDMDIIFSRLYEHVNQLMDAAIFGVGVYHKDREEIEYRLAYAKGVRYEPYTRDAHDKNQFPVWCIDNQKPVFINDVSIEYSQYIESYQENNYVLEDGTVPEDPVSLIYLPLVAKNQVLGIITVQSYQRDAYTTYHLNILENLAAFTTTALDNANAYRQLNTTLDDLKNTQQQLVTQEKLASLGALTAGIAHEIKNPLNFVNNFADLNTELADELREELAASQDKQVAEVLDELTEILMGLKINSAQIAKHGKRADNIVKNMMEHASGGASERYRIDANAFIEEYVSLAYHGKRAQDPNLKVEIERDYDESLGNVELSPQEMGRVLVNLLNNAIDAVHEQAVANNGEYVPTVTVRTRKMGRKAEIRIADNGPGIPLDLRQKIFEPFFTTKPTGSGTGLGLSLSYDIITQGHGGKLVVESKEGEGATFVITLPA